MKKLLIISLLLSLLLLGGCSTQKKDYGLEICTQFKYILPDNSTTTTNYENGFCILDDHNFNRSTYVIRFDTYSEELNIILKTNKSMDVCQFIKEDFYNELGFKKIFLDYNCYKY